MQKSLKLLTNTVPFLVWALVIIGITFWAVTTYKNAHNPFKTDSNKDFKFYSDVVDEQSKIGKHYTLIADVHTDPCGSNLGSLLGNEADNNCLKTVDVKKVYWPDGGSTTFDKCPMVAFNFDPTDCKASNGVHHTYGVVLFDKKP